MKPTARASRESQRKVMGRNFIAYDLINRLLPDQRRPRFALDGPNYKRKHRISAALGDSVVSPES